jgi:coenzyme F420-reducing hydrogenase delta subunit
MDAQYLFHALEGGARGVCVVACPKGKCHLAQGNYRAEVRLRTVQRLLAEIGMEPGRAEMIHTGDGNEPASAEQIERLLRDAVGRICTLGESPLRV